MLLVVIFTVGQAFAQTSLPKYLNDIVDNGVAKGNLPYIWRTGGIMLAMTVIM